MGVNGGDSKGDDGFNLEEDSSGEMYSDEDDSEGNDSKQEAPGPLQPILSFCVCRERRFPREPPWKKAIFRQTVRKEGRHEVPKNQIVEFVAT